MTTSDNRSDSQGKNSGHASVHHIVPMSVYNRVFGILIVLTVLTVAVSYVDFGSFNVFIAMLIATAKAMCVILFFMGLKYDGLENNVTFFGTFYFLVLFVGLSGADLFYRDEPLPARVDASENPPQSSGGSVDVNALVKPSDDALAKGKVLFSQNCITCHGAGGHGDGVAAAALNPKPRNFTVTDGWKNGHTVAAIYKTLTNGLGTMPAFALPVADRFALAHYVRSLGAEASGSGAGSAEELAALTKELGAPPKARITIDQAIEKLAQEYEAREGQK